MTQIAVRYRHPRLNTHQLLRYDLDPGEPNQARWLGYMKKGYLRRSDVFLCLECLLKPGDVFVDIGANFGLHTIQAGHSVGEAGQVIAVEASPCALEALQANIALNGFSSRCHVVSQPLAEKPGAVTFYLNALDNGGNALWDPSVLLKKTNEAVPVLAPLTLEATTLDSLLPAMALSRPPKVIKIDTEGAEAAILRGGTKSLSPATTPFIIAENHEFGLRQMGDTSQGLRQMMAAWGYDCFLLLPQRHFPLFIPPGTALKTPYVLNYLFTTAESVAAYWPQIDPFNL